MRRFKNETVSSRFQQLMQFCRNRPTEDLVNQFLAAEDERIKASGGLTEQQQEEYREFVQAFVHCFGEDSVYLTKQPVAQALRLGWAVDHKSPALPIDPEQDAVLSALAESVLALPGDRIVKFFCFKPEASNPTETVVPFYGTADDRDAARTLFWKHAAPMLAYDGHITVKQINTREDGKYIISSYLCSGRKVFRESRRLAKTCLEIQRDGNIIHDRQAVYTVAPGPFPVQE